MSSTRTVLLIILRETESEKLLSGTVCNGQSFNLSVLATTVTSGVAVGTVDLVTGSPAIDFIRDIPRRAGGSCRLNYTASATFAQGNSTENGNDSHRVTYTIVRQ